MPRKITILLAILVVTILIVYSGNYFYTNYYLPSTVHLPPPLANVEFPSEPAQYPADWPDELKFPSDFVLVDSSSGTLPESTSQGWGTKLRYNGKPFEAKSVVISFLNEKGWIIVESNKLDSGGFMLLIEQTSGSGVIVIDTDPTNPLQTLIIATTFSG